MFLSEYPHVWYIIALTGYYGGSIKLDAGVGTISNLTVDHMALMKSVVKNSVRMLWHSLNLMVISLSCFELVNEPIVMMGSGF